MYRNLEHTSLKTPEGRSYVMVRENIRSRVGTPPRRLLSGVEDLVFSCTRQNKLGPPPCAISLDGALDARHRRLKHDI